MINIGRAVKKRLHDVEQNTEDSRLDRLFRTIQLLLSFSFNTI